MMTCHFSAMTPQQAPLPRAAWQASAFGASTAFATAHWPKGRSTRRARPIRKTVASALFQSPKRLRRSQGRAPPVRTGGALAAID